MNLKPHLWGMRQADLQTALIRFGIEEKKARYHARHIFRWIYKRKVTSIDEMTDLSKPVRETLTSNFEIKTPVKQTLMQESVDGTRKFLFKLDDGQMIESVLIPARAERHSKSRAARLTVCISSQVGCAMGCKFCLTASMGLIRNLKVEEIVGQVLELTRIANITNIVFMGMGEPLHNLENVARSLEILLHQDGLDFSKRKVTVSTSGLVPALKKFNERLPKEIRVNLAISLNGSNNESRGLVMPVNKAFPLEELLETCRNYFLEPHRRITFEYVMMKDINDTLEDARRILKLLRGIPSKVNLIPFNPHHASPFERPEENRLNEFQKYLLDRGQHVTTRHSSGRDILAACGQLATS